MGKGLSPNAGGCLIDIALDAALARIAKLKSLLVASDFDGTLAPIVDDPAAARADGAAMDAFLKVADNPRTHAAIVSGRSVDVLEQFVGSTDNVILVGNHGSSLTSDSDRATVRHLVLALTDLASKYSGTQVEAKPTGAAFHVRRADQPDAAANAAREIAEASGATVIEGKQIVEAVIGQGDKGTAITALRTSTGATAVFFVGDDVTDEAVFATLGAHDVGVKVGDGETAAQHRVPDVSAVADVFNRLARYLDRSRD